MPRWFSHAAQSRPSAAAPEAPSNASDARDPEVVVDVGVEEVTGSDVGDITTNWFDSFPAALPASIRDRLLAQLEEFVLNPQIAVSLEIAIALVGVVEPGQGIVSAEAADETTITYEAVLNGYDAAIDVAADIERGQGVAASASAGIAVSEAIIDAAEVIDAVTDIVVEVNAQIQADQARTEGGDDASSAVAAQGSGSGANASATPDSNATAATPPKILAARNKAQPFHNLATATRRTAVGKVPDRVASARPLRVAAQGARRRGLDAREDAQRVHLAPAGLGVRRARLELDLVGSDGSEGAGVVEDDAARARALVDGREVGRAACLCDAAGAARDRREER